MKALLLPNFARERTPEVLKLLLVQLEKAGILAVGLQSQEKELEPLGVPVVGEGRAKDCDVLLAVGGDGTMIQSARYSARWKKPLAGIDTGTLGYLMEIDRTNLPEAVEQLARGEYTVQLRHALRVSWPDGQEPFVLNDILLQRVGGYGLVDFAVFCQGKPLCRCRADGLLFSTPTGSTAQLMSYGGPIVEPGVNGIVIKAIGVQLGEAASLVFPLDWTFSVQFQQEVQLICDGQRRTVLPPQGEVIIKKAPNVARFLRFREQTSIHRIREKLFYLDQRSYYE